MPIAKVTVGKSAYGCLNYVLTKDKAELLDTNCAADTPAVMAREFEVAFQPHHRNGAKRHTENYVAHFSIAFSSELEPPQLRAIAHRFMDLMGFDPVMNQFVLAKHNDTDDCHLHLIENRIRLDGQVVNDSFQKRRTEVAMRTLEEEFDLPRLKNSWEVDVKAPSVAEVRQSRETGKPIPRRVIQESIERCVVGTETLEDLQNKLQQAGVTLIATPRDDGSWALLYQLAIENNKVRTFSATKLGKRYTQRGLESIFGISFGADEVTVEAQVDAARLAALPIDVATEPTQTELNAGSDHSVTESEATETETGRAFAVVPPERDCLVKHAVTESITVETVSVTAFIEPEPPLVTEPSSAPAVTESALAPEAAAVVLSEGTLDLPPVAIADAEQEDGLRDGWSVSTNKQVQAESLKALLQWTQNHIEALEQRAVWVGLQNASDQERWEVLSAQTQQRGLTDVQQIESAVTALACQQGYKTEAIVGLLQQSPRVQRALRTHPWHTVKTTLTQNVVQIQQALEKRQREARRAQTRRAQDGKM
ncbi:relaxase/mobilization nuclease domain-containing protein [Phormidium sp. FACHB-592]|uniref:Relaxase/mobilization nuclease domain-containing protein n=1 Tax=Stenomitos frigidus AS-A4 TaxID=2933935 RepID=A0ABV0KP42_9CYAN|nr:relaxase/mobilization nuclease domain-containing protein [Phormidium sp. FACHB-592]MBD2073347.1 relaxase/mobilization nuclease domain-containing protein [Phormidium sp. FACHB-592]